MSQSGKEKICVGFFFSLFYNIPTAGAPLDSVMTFGGNPSGVIILPED